LYRRSLYKYARYFAKRHPKVVEDEKAIHTIIHLEEETAAAQSGMGRRMTVRTIHSVRSGPDINDEGATSPLAHITTGISPLQRSNTVVRVITEPEPAHMRMGNQALATPTMEKEGIAGADYFFNQTEPKFDAVDVSPDMDVEKANHRARRSR
jgi:hypothetical protein